MPLLTFRHETEITLTFSPAVLQRVDRALTLAEKFLTFLETPPKPTIAGVTVERDPLPTV